MNNVRFKQLYLPNGII